MDRVGVAAILRAAFNLQNPKADDHVAMMFVNYRTPDESGTAGLLKHKLSLHFGPDNVFLAGTDISPGTDFEREILRRVRGSMVLLALIGPRWLTATDRRGQLAIESEHDWVRREIAEAIASGVRVVPILTDDTERLTDAELPADIAPLARYQYLRLRHDNLTYDLARIVDEIARLMPPNKAGSARSPQRSAHPAGTQVDAGMSGSFDRYREHRVPPHGQQVVNEITGTVNAPGGVFGIQNN